MADEDNIVPLRRGRDPEEFRVTASNCTHFRGCLIDEKTRQVTCRDCGALLDPFDRLLRIANDAERQREQIKNWKIEIGALIKRAGSLKRLERNARARIGRLGEEVHNDTKWRGSGNPAYPPPHPPSEVVVSSVRGIPLGHVVIGFDPPMELSAEQAGSLTQQLRGALGDLWEAKRKREAERG